MNLLWFGNLLFMRLWVWNAYSILLWNRALAYPRALLHSGGPMSCEFWHSTKPLSCFSGFGRVLVMGVGGLSLLFFLFSGFGRVLVMGAGGLGLWAIQWVKSALPQPCEVYVADVLVSLTLSILNLPLSSSSTTSRELLSQFSTCGGWRWLGVSEKFKKIVMYW